MFVEEQHAKEENDARALGAFTERPIHNRNRPSSWAPDAEDLTGHNRASLGSGTRTVYWRGISMPPSVVRLGKAAR